MSDIDDFGDTPSALPQPRAPVGIVKAGEKEEKKDLNGRVQWAQAGPSLFIGTGTTRPTLEAGVYSIGSTPQGESIFIQKEVNVDSLLKFPDSQGGEILNEINTFWTKFDIFQKYGFLHRRGVLLYGPPGCHAKGTRIVMFDGSWKSVEDIIIGDILFGPHAEPKTVLALCRGQDRMFKITPEKGDSFVVNQNHVMHLTDASTDASCPPVVNIKLSDFLSAPITFQERFKLTRSDKEILKFSAQSIGVGNYYGFTLTGDHLYLTPDNIIHHNSGKTSLVQQIISDIISLKGIVFLCQNPGTVAAGLATFREIEPVRNVVCIFEDIDAIIKNYGDETLLSVLDGEHQIDRVLNIGTTNYPENLDKRIISRPRRFDRVIKIGMPSDVVRREYFVKKLNITPEEVGPWVADTKDFSFAAMAELVISVKCFEIPFKKAVERLRKLMVAKPSSSEEDGRMGF